MKSNKSEDIKLICLTPVVNEAFELDRFIQCASTWADHIIVGYQKSTDRTLEILGNYEKVTVVNSPNEDWNELAMRSLLYAEARKINAAKRIIFNLDADELLSANFMHSPEWRSILNLPAGSVVRIPWCNLGSEMTSYRPGNMIEVAFVDDGVSMLSGTVMHMGRVPWAAYDIQILRCCEIKLLHYQLTNPERQKSKDRWYIAYEKVGKSEFGPRIYRKYRSKPNLPPEMKVDQNWLKGYEDLGIDVTSVVYGYDYSHDYRLLAYLEEYGTDYFRMCDIWEKDWVQFATGKKKDPERFRDPRTASDRLVYRYFRWSSTTNRTGLKNSTITWCDLLLKWMGYSS